MSALLLAAKILGMHSRTAVRAIKQRRDHLPLKEWGSSDFARAAGRAS